jgi:hypothetical protein
MGRGSVRNVQKSFGNSKQGFVFDLRHLGCFVRSVGSGEEEETCNYIVRLTTSEKCAGLGILSSQSCWLFGPAQVSTWTWCRNLKAQCSQTDHSAQFDSCTNAICAAKLILANKEKLNHANPNHRHFWLILMASEFRKCATWYIWSVVCEKAYECHAAE